MRHKALTDDFNADLSQILRAVQGVECDSTHVFYALNLNLVAVHGLNESEQRVCGLKVLRLFFARQSEWERYWLRLVFVFDHFDNARVLQLFALSQDTCQTGEVVPVVHAFE